MSNYTKGKSYEEEVKVWLEGKGFAVAMRQPKKGKIASRPYECDLMATKSSFFWKAVSFLGGMAAIAGVILLIANELNPSSLGADVTAQIEGAMPSDLKGYGVILIGILAFIIGRIASGRQALTIWVECRNRQAPVDRNYIFEVFGKRQDIEGEHHEVWVASATGFRSDAVDIATTKKIHCVTFKDGKAVLENKDLSSRVL